MYCLSKCSSKVESCPKYQREWLHGGCTRSQLSAAKEHAASMTHTIAYDELLKVQGHSAVECVNITKSILGKDQPDIVTGLATMTQILSPVWQQ